VHTRGGGQDVADARAPRLPVGPRDPAPGVTLRLLPEQAVDTLELKHGHLDLEIGSGGPGLPEIRTRTLLEDRLVVALRAGHALADHRLTARRFAAADHVIVSRRGRLTDPIDELLDARGLRRRVLATAPTSTAALHFAASSDLLIVVSERLCRPTIEALGLRTVPVPLELPPVPLVVAWHERYEDDRAHRWLRSIVAEAVERVAGDAPGSDDAP
jgi:DNA-binding transcriptional LysR family regulator